MKNDTELEACYKTQKMKYLPHEKKDSNSD